MTPLVKGDSIQITAFGRTILGTVLLASPNSESVLVAFDGWLASYLNSMAVMWDSSTGDYRDLFEGRRVELRKQTLQ